ncbi:phage tail protein, partial [Klebsiella michiganensis]
FTISLSRADADFREKLQTSSVSDVLDDLKTSATKAVNSVSNSLSSLF